MTIDILYIIIYSGDLKLTILIPCCPDLEHSNHAELMDMEQAKKARTSAKSQFTRAETSLTKSLESSDILAPTIERRFEELRAKWEKVQDAHDDYAELAVDAKDAEGNPVDNNLEGWLEEIIERFENVEIRTDKRVAELKKKDDRKPEGGEKGKDKSERVSAVKIEKSKFPPFDGQLRKYPQFRVEFNNFIKPQCNKSELAFVLRNHLVSAVREEVESCGDDYSAIWDRLDHLYGNKGKLVDLILQDIKSLPFSKDDSKVTLQMIKIIERAQWDLIRLDAEDEMCNSTIISIIEQRMPYKMKEDWAESIANETNVMGKTKFVKLMAFLKKTRNKLEYMNDGLRSAPEVRGKTLNLEIPAAENNPPNQNRCIFHKAEGPLGDHPIWRCRDFMLLPVEERIKIVTEQKACQVCLRTNCPGTEGPSNCRSNMFRCKINGCQGKHNRILHTTVPPIRGTNMHIDDDTATPGNTILQVQNL